MSCVYTFMIGSFSRGVYIDICCDDDDMVSFRSWQVGLISIYMYIGNFKERLDSCAVSFLFSEKKKVSSMQ